MFTLTRHHPALHSFPTRRSSDLRTVSPTCAWPASSCAESFRVRRMVLWYARCRTDCKTIRSEEHTSELQSPYEIVCRLLLEKKNKKQMARAYTSKTVWTASD